MHNLSNFFWHVTSIFSELRHLRRNFHATIDYFVRGCISRVFSVPPCWYWPFTFYRCRTCWKNAKHYQLTRDVKCQSNGWPRKVYIIVGLVRRLMFGCLVSYECNFKIRKASGFLSFRFLTLSNYSRRTDKGSSIFPPTVQKKCEHIVTRYKFCDYPNNIPKTDHLMTVTLTFCSFCVNKILIFILTVVDMWYFGLSGSFVNSPTAELNEWYCRLTIHLCWSFLNKKSVIFTWTISSISGFVLVILKISFQLSLDSFKSEM